MLDYASLQTLSAVAREGSFERAARTLHVTPSAVSQRIRLLEDRVGCALISRGQPCVPTETGLRLCQHIDRVRLLEHELQLELPALEAAQKDWVQLPVAINADSLATWFAPAIIAVSQRSGVLVQLSVDHEGHTATWLRQGAVLAAVTADPEPVAGCTVRALGVMRYVAVAQPAFIARYFGQGVDANSLTTAPCLTFDAKDQLQQRWADQHIQQGLVLPRHALPSPQAFVMGALGGMGWGMHPLAMVREHLASGRLLELVPNASLDVPLYWLQARLASSLLQDLTAEVVLAARSGLDSPDATR